MRKPIHVLDDEQPEPPEPPHKPRHNKHSFTRHDKRRYDRSGATTARRNLPTILARITGDIAAADLSPLELAAREWRDGVIADCGGRPTLAVTKLSAINVALGSWLLLSTIDSYLMHLAATASVLDKKHRRLYPIANERMRVADSLVKQLQAIGLDKASAPPQTLDTYLAQKYGEAARPTNGAGT